MANWRHSSIARRQIVALFGEALQHRGIGAPGAGFHALSARHAHAVEQDFAELLGRTDVERLAGEAMDVLLHDRHAGGKILRHGAQVVGIHLHAGAFHVEQNRDQAAVDLLVEAQAPCGAQARPQHLPQA